MSERIKDVEHGVVCARPDDPMGYFGWPSVARMDDGEIVVGASGPRMAHVGPYGKTVLFSSRDDGATWSEPFVLTDTALDDRDAGIICLGGRARLVSWFTSIGWITRFESASQRVSPEEAERWRTMQAELDEGTICELLGSWVRVSEDGETWSDFIRVPVSAPAGPILLANGDLLYLGTVRKASGSDEIGQPLQAALSSDRGMTWEVIGDVTPGEGTPWADLTEPHAVELPSGRIIGLIRYQHRSPERAHPTFSLCQTESDDGGRTWSPVRALGIEGSPPHVIRHSSGVLVCTYGYRLEPFGQRVMLSEDDGATWRSDLILRDDGPTRDLGYPCSCELPDGSLLTIYYQEPAPGKKCAILWSRWRLP